LILTKPLGVSIITVGYSAEEISEEAFVKATTSMETLNKYAMAIIRNYEINSCTDVTGFGLAGHLHEMVNGQYSAEIDSARLPYFEEAYQGAKEFILTAGGQRNRNYMEDKIDFQLNDFGIEELLFDPQTSGGLLVSVPADEAAALVAELQAAGIPAQDFGTIIEKQDKELIVY
jgi:selenide,water dikinase